MMDCARVAVRRALPPMGNVLLGVGVPKVDVGDDRQTP